MVLSAIAQFALAKRCPPSSIYRAIVVVRAQQQVAEHSHVKS
jgi:hypothetical protein